MSKPTNTIPPNLQAWIQARKRHHLSHAHVQMARELGMNPTKLGSIDNHRQEPWKAPLPEFIESLYLKRFGRERPEVVVTVEERARQLRQQKASRKEAKAKRHSDPSITGERPRSALSLQPQASHGATRGGVRPGARLGRHALARASCEAVAGRFTRCSSRQP